MSSFNITTQTSTLSSPGSNGKASPVGDATNNNNTTTTSSTTATATAWDEGSDVFVFCHEMSPTDESVQAGMSSVPSGLDGHLPLLHGRHRAAEDGLMLELSSPEAYLDAGALDYSDSDGQSAGPLFERRKRSRSNSSRHRGGDVVTELGPDEVRWFYKEDKKTWKPFVGHDSLKIEVMFRKYLELHPGAEGSRVGGGEEEQEEEEEEGDRSDRSTRSGGESRGLNGAVAVAVDSRTSSVHAGRGSLDTSTVSSDERDHDGIDINVEPVCVRGGLYEVDVKEKECNPVYWKREYVIPKREKQTNKQTNKQKMEVLLWPSLK